jgi:nicotinate-nucleotide pyrophosphorylase (carboxylating)
MQATRVTQAETDAIARAVSIALAEDIGSGDLTAGLIGERRVAETSVVVRDEAVLCGRPWFDQVFEQLDPSIETRWLYADGDALSPQATVCRMTGPARAILTGERTALNFLQLLSGTATATRAFVSAIRGTRAHILDTRKTIPGLRSAQKYAVACGGGSNHRMGLYDAVLIKENHIAAAGGLTRAVVAAEAQDGPVLIEVEVETLEQLREALTTTAKRVLLDNFGIEDLRQAVNLRDAGRRELELEASGGINLGNVRAVAETGVDFISVGEITKHVRATDYSMRFV